MYQLENVNSTLWFINIVVHYTPSFIDYIDVYVYFRHDSLAPFESLKIIIFIALNSFRS